jgi:hypothetical protein
MSRFTRNGQFALESGCRRTYVLALCGKRVSNARRRMSDVLPLRRTSSSSLANFRNCFDALQKSYRAMPSLRVVVSYDHIQAVKKYYVRAGGN